MARNGRMARRRGRITDKRLTRNGRVAVRCFVSALRVIRGRFSGTGETRATKLPKPSAAVFAQARLATNCRARYSASGGRLAIAVDFPLRGAADGCNCDSAAWASPERLNFWYNTRQREQRKVIRYVDPMLQAARQEDRGTQRRRSRCGRRRRRGSFKENEARRKEARRDVRQPKRRGKKRGAASAAPLFLPRSEGWLTSRRAS